MEKEIVTHEAISFNENDAKLFHEDFKKGSWAATQFPDGWKTLFFENLKGRRLCGGSSNQSRLRCGLGLVARSPRPPLAFEATLPSPKRHNF